MGQGRVEVVTQDEPPGNLHYPHRDNPVPARRGSPGYPFGQHRVPERERAARPSAVLLDSL